MICIRVFCTADEKRSPHPCGMLIRIKVVKGELSLFTQLAHDLARFGKSPRLVLRVDEITIDHDVKDAAASRYERRLLAECSPQFIRQTGGTGFIVSLYTVTDFDLHGVLLNVVFEPSRFRRETP